MQNTTAKKLNIALVFGGRSCEHEVSVISAQSILKAIPEDKYNLYMIGISKKGKWFLSRDFNDLTDNSQVIDEIQNKTTTTEVVLPAYENAELISISPSHHIDQKTFPIDVVFSVLHGPFGEDGHIQGLLNMADIAYVGCDLAASAVAMDKSLTKKVLSSADIPQCPHIDLTYFKWQDIKDKQQQAQTAKAICEKLGNILFTKPASMGSSVGISKTHDDKALIEAIDFAFKFDNTIVIETAMEGYAEIECAILGNEHGAKASVLGEIVPNADFYDYETKYVSDNSQTETPARIADELTEKIQKCALDAFAAIDATGMARIDFLVHKETGHFILNEINTLPGFTPISMYPQLWQASGIDYPSLIDKLIQLALSTQQNKNRLQKVLIDSPLK